MTEISALYKLYFAPMACSLAVRILLNELKVDVEYVPVDLATKTLPDKTSYATVNPKMQVPALVLPDGEMLTELAVIVQYLADRHPESRFIAEAGSSLRRKQEEWLSFLSGELHKSIFYIFYHPSASPAVKDFARSIADRPLKLVSDALTDRPYLTGEYSVADMLLLVMLLWVEPAGLKLSNWPTLEEYRARLFQRDALRTAVFNEKLLFEPA